MAIFSVSNHNAKSVVQDIENGQGLDNFEGGRNDGGNCKDLRISRFIVIDRIGLKRYNITNIFGIWYQGDFQIINMLYVWICVVGTYGFFTDLWDTTFEQILFLNVKKLRVLNQIQQWIYIGMFTLEWCSSWLEATKKKGMVQ